MEEKKGIKNVPINCNPNKWIQIPYVNPTPSELPIVGNGMMVGFSYFDKSYLELVKECGVNIVSSAFSANSGLKSVMCTLEGEPPKTGAYCNIQLDPSQYAINILESVKNVKEIGLKIFICGPHLEVNSIDNVDPYKSPKWMDSFEVWRRLVEIFKKESCVAGWMLCDEPNLSFFWGLRELRYLILEEEQGLIVMSDGSDNKFNFDQIDYKIDQIEPDAEIHKLMYSNLLPYIVVEKTPYEYYESRALQLNGPLWNKEDNTVPGWGEIYNYEDYYNYYVINLEPNFVTFDVYPFYKNIEVGDSKFKLNSAFFETLAFYSSDIRSRMTFWAYIQTTDITICNIQKDAQTGEIIKRTEKNYISCSSLGMMRFAIFNSLAFGAQGLVYWRMTPGVQNSSTGGDVHEITNGPISGAGEKTPVYDILKQVTKQVRDHQELFILSSDVSLRKVCVGVTEWPTDSVADYQKVKLHKISVSNISGDSYYSELISSINSPGRGWTVSVMTKNYNQDASGKQKIEQILVIVNLDWENDQELDIKFKEYVKDETGYSTTPILPTDAKEVDAFSDLKVVNPQIVIPPSGTIKSFKGTIAPGDWKIFTRSYTK